jgi:hypothetical protein
MSILLGRPRLQGHPNTSAMVVFLDNLSRLLVCVDNVHITLRPDSTAHRLSPGEFDLGSFMFGTMLDLTTSPSTHLSTTVWRCVPAYLALDIDNCMHDFVAPPTKRDGALHVWSNHTMTATCCSSPDDRS